MIKGSEKSPERILKGSHRKAAITVERTNRETENAHLTHVGKPPESISLARTIPKNMAGRNHIAPIRPPISTGPIAFMVPDAKNIFLRLAHITAVTCTVSVGPVMHLFRISNKKTKRDVRK